MTYLGGLEEALAEPLLEGPLQLDPVQAIERGAEAPVGLPGTEEIPVVTIGAPRAWPIPAPPLAPGGSTATMSTVAPVIGSEERVLLLRMACSFRPRSDQTQIVWARFTARLFPDDQQLPPPIALDLYPSIVEVERKVTRRVTLSPSLKLTEVEATLGEAEFTVEYPAVDPIISAGGPQEDLVSWDFSEAPGHVLHGGKLLMAVVAAPAQMRRLEVACLIQADLRHRGLRLPTWLGGSTPKAHDARRTVAWQDATQSRDGS
jgi:hypothetical protein